MAGDSGEDKEKLLDFALDKLNYNVILSDEEYLSEEKIEIEHIEDYCLFLMIFYMDYNYKNFKEYNLLALKARYIRTKEEALNNLKKISYELADNDLEEIKNIYDKEKNSHSKKSLGLFLESLDEDIKGVKVESREKFKVIKHVKDIFLTDINIENLNQLKVGISKGKMIYLKIEKDDSSCNDIKILDSRGDIVGYVPEMVNNILKNLLDWGKIIYGIILEKSKD